MAGTKTSENIKKVEPLFEAKNQQYELLNQRVKQRESIKDNKIEYVLEIRKALIQLKQLR